MEVFFFTEGGRGASPGACCTVMKVGLASLHARHTLDRAVGWVKRNDGRPRLLVELHGGGNRLAVESKAVLMCERGGEGYNVEQPQVPPTACQRAPHDTQ